MKRNSTKKRKIISIDITSLPPQFKNLLENTDATYKDIFLAGLQKISQDLSSTSNLSQIQSQLQQLYNTIQLYQENKSRTISKIISTLNSMNHTLLDIQEKIKDEEIKNKISTLINSIYHILKLLKKL